MRTGAARTNGDGLDSEVGENPDNVLIVVYPLKKI
jgi:hypothetical protein